MKERRNDHVLRKGFKFEASWVLDEEYGSVLKDAWNGGIARNHDAHYNLLHCQPVFSWWSLNKFGNTTRSLREKSRRLEDLQCNEVQNNREEIKCPQSEIDLILEQEDLKWKQRSQQNWYLHGDRNTPFFHSWATHRLSHRHEKNHIRRVKDDSGRVWSQSRDIGHAFVQFY
jgi:hypothetical protein